MKHEKRKKNLFTYKIYTAMSRRFDLSEDRHEQLIAILNEPDMEEFDFEAIHEQHERLIALFEVPHHVFTDIYIEERHKVMDMMLVESN